MKQKRYKIKGTAEPDSAGCETRNAQGINASGNNFVIIGSSDQELDDLTLVENIRQHNKHTPIIMIAGETSEKQMAAALEIGLSDFIGLPLTTEHIMTRLKKHRDPTIQKKESVRHVDDTFVIGQSKEMKQIKAFLNKIAMAESNVLITGETGTGKDIAAEYIHAKSRRSAKPLVCVNCTAFPETLLESELFGYEKGSFTNAVSSRAGKFEMASGSTLFLDEIGDMGPGAQAKILRAIEKKEVWRIGGDRPLYSDFRLIAATNSHLEDLIDRGAFREDLFYRLNIARVHIPPLRERKEDIEALSHFAIKVFNRKFGLSIKGISPEVISVFRSFDWPGNVRQLNNVIESAFINEPKDILKMQDLPGTFHRDARKKDRCQPDEGFRIRQVLLETGKNKSAAAKKLNISRMTLYRKMSRYDIPLD